jgi:hypothetical protein
VVDSFAEFLNLWLLYLWRFKYSNNKFDFIQTYYHVNDFQTCIRQPVQPRPSCRILFKQLEILPVPCQYVLSFINFFISNQDNFQTNSSLHHINARYKHYLHRPNANMACFQKIHFMLASEFAKVYMQTDNPQEWQNKI